MSERKTTRADLLERSAATHWAENHPLRGLVRQAMFLTLARLTNKDRIVYAGVRFLAWRMGSNTRTVTKIMLEFRERGLVEFIGKSGLGGQNRYRLNYEESVSIYPDTLTSEQFKVSNAVPHFNDDEVWNGIEHFEQAKCGTDAGEVWNGQVAKCGMDTPEVWNGMARSVEHHSTKDIEVNKQEKNQDQSGALLAQRRRARDAHGHAPPSAAAAKPDDDDDHRKELIERIEWMTNRLRSYRVLPNWNKPQALARWAADARVDDAFLRDAYARFLALGKVKQRVREFDKIVKAMLIELDNARYDSTHRRRRKTSR
ncbi:hypothetical protein CBA19CS22_36885 [Caballeronia novacaledonica]|uniref:Uncharacterized protein n=1 Tax=Caballeronia novacaledonica TaxID=1544861 RepID=A0ACB5R4Z6_9BURK|nr:hypothetical protein CBA19CS22_36885 [Caballeronia novacaledonica]